MAAGSGAAARRARVVATAAGALSIVGWVAWLCAPLLRGEQLIVRRDALSAVLPVKLILADALQKASLPVWNPAPALGKPFLADPLTGTLYPGNLPLLLTPFSAGYGLLLTAHLAWGGIGALLLLRCSGLPLAASLLGAIVWAAGGAMLSLTDVANHLCAIVWLPWVLWGWSRPLAVGRKIALAAALLAVAVLTGSPEMVALIAGAVLLWARDSRALVVPPLAAGLAGLGVVPILRYAAQSWRGAHGFSADAVLRFSAPPEQLLQLVRDTGPLEPAPFLASVYVGPLAVGLALLGLAGASRRRMATGLALALAIVLVALGPATPVGPLFFRHVPLVSLVRYPGKLLVALHALVALGAALGCARVVAWGAAGGRWSAARRRAAALLATCLVLATAADLARNNRSLVVGEPAAEFLDPPPIARAMRSEAQRSAVGLAARPARYYANPTGAPAPRSAADAARRDRDLLFAATGELYGLANVNTPSSLNLIAHERLQQALAAAPRESALDALAALGVLWVTTWEPLEQSAIARPVALADDAGGARLYRLDGAAERAFVARRVVVAADALNALGRFVLSTPGRHRGLAVLEAGQAAAVHGEVLEAPSDGPQAGAPASDARSASGSEPPASAGSRLESEPPPPRWLVDRPARLELEVSLERPAVLVVSDTWSEGWSTTVDGAAAPLLRVNGLVRGVSLPAGAHRVVMEYSPPGLALGAALSALSAAIALLLASAPARRRPA